MILIIAIEIKKGGLHVDHVSSLKFLSQQVLIDQTEIKKC